MNLKREFENCVLSILVCMACMAPGMFSLRLFGYNFFSCLVLFWGGMIYQVFLKKKGMV